MILRTVRKHTVRKHNLNPKYLYLGSAFSLVVRMLVKTSAVPYQRTWVRFLALLLSPASG